MDSYTIGGKCSVLVTRCTLIVLLLVLFISKQCVAELHSVHTSLGNVTGSTEQVPVYNDAGKLATKSYVQYLGIPYAEPPTGDGRFAKAEAKRPWTFQLNATFYRPSCYFSGDNARDIELSEDCLTLDIYAPIETTEEGSTLLPVLVFIHNMPGSSRTLIGDVLSVYSKLLVVVINYRQGILGFLSTGDATAWGNFGLWDQTLAIEWVNEHIPSFGGDTSKITLVGEGTGASDVILHALYPPSAGRFQRIVAMSGTPIPAYNTENNTDDTHRLGQEIARLMYCPSEITTDMLECLRGKPVQELVSAAVGTGRQLGFKPVVDGQFIKANPMYMLNNVNDMYTEEINVFTSMDMMIGLNNNEGVHLIASTFAGMFNQNAANFSVNYTEFTTVIIPRALNMLYDEHVPGSVSKLAGFQYTDISDPNSTDSVRQGVVDLLTDLDLAVPLTKTANIHSAANISRTFLYEFSQSLHRSKAVVPHWLSGAGQGNAFNFLLGLSQRRVDALMSIYTYAPTESDMQVARQFMTVVAEFSRSGNPTPPGTNSPLLPVWFPYNPNTSPYLHIEHNATSLKHHFREPRLTFWTQGVPAVLQDFSEITSDDTASGDKCPKQLGTLFKVDMLTAENIILALSINAFCLLIACLIICTFSIARERPSREYTVNPIHKRQ